MSSDGSGLDWGSLLHLTGESGGSTHDQVADTCFLLTTTAIGATVVALDQYLLQAAINVWLGDPFPLKEADWLELLDGSLADFFRPRDIYSMSYFLTVETKRWGSRISSCRALAEAARRFRAGRADGIEEIIAASAAAANDSGAHASLIRHAAFRCLAGCDPRSAEGDNPRELWREASAAIGEGRIQAPPLPAKLEAQGLLHWRTTVDAELDAATRLGQYPPLLSPAPAWPVGLAASLAGGPVIDAVMSKLALAGTEAATRGPELFAARLAGGGPKSFQALTPVAALGNGRFDGAALDPQQLWGYGWARRKFRGDGRLLIAIEAALRVFHS